MLGENTTISLDQLFPSSLLYIAYLIGDVVSWFRFIHKDISHICECEERARKRVVAKRLKRTLHYLSFSLQLFSPAY